MFQVSSSFLMIDSDYHHSCIIAFEGSRFYEVVGTSSSHGICDNATWDILQEPYRLKLLEMNNECVMVTDGSRVFWLARADQQREHQIRWKGYVFKSVSWFFEDQIDCHYISLIHDWMRIINMPAAPIRSQRHDFEFQLLRVLFICGSHCSTVGRDNSIASKPFIISKFQWVDDENFESEYFTQLRYVKARTVLNAMLIDGVSSIKGHWLGADYVGGSARCSIDTLRLSSFYHIDPSECIAYHGTCPCKADKIMKQGIQLEFARAGMCGVGIYASPDFCKTRQYTKTCLKCEDTRSNEHHVLILRVNLGATLVLDRRPTGEEIQQAQCGQSVDSIMTRCHGRKVEIVTYRNDRQLIIARIIGYEAM